MIIKSYKMFTILKSITYVSLPMTSDPTCLTISSVSPLVDMSADELSRPNFSTRTSPSILFYNHMDWYNSVFFDSRIILILEIYKTVGKLSSF